MSKVLVTESSLSGIAAAIRAKNGTQNTYNPGQMAAAIESIPTGGITPTGTVNITQNGTHDVTQYASANVNVQPNLQSKTVTENGTVTPDQGYDGLSSVVVNVSGGGGGGGGDDPSIPAEYQEVEYLGFTGTQFVLAPVTVNNRQIFSVKGLLGDSELSNEQDFAGFDNSGCIYYENNSVKRYGSIAELLVQNASIPVVANSTFVYYARINSTGNDTVIIGTYRSTNPVHSVLDGRVYAVRIMQALSSDFGINNIYWFVPCVRKADNVAGFYEAINGNFYVNQGTGDFVVGPNV